MKHYRKYPYGILVKPVQREPYKNSNDPLYELSDDNNKRQRIRYSQLAELANKNPYKIDSYPRQTIIGNNNSRNKFIKNENGAYVKVYNGPNKGGGFKGKIAEENKTHYAKFTIIQNGTETLGMHYQQPEIICPIKSINPSNGKFYGRDNCRIIISEKEESNKWQN